MFTFQSSNDAVLFKCDVEVAKLSGTFSKLISRGNLHVICNVETKPVVYNTTEMLRIIHEYFLLHEENPTGSNYVEEKPILHNYIDKILTPKDLEFCRKYAATPTQQAQLLQQANEYLQIP
jgi:hypothetical protein